MQQIERYGVIALVFLLVTIVAISFWGDSKSPGFWSRLTGKSAPKKEEVAQLEPELPPHIADPAAPLTNVAVVGGPQDLGPGPVALPPGPIENPSLGNGSIIPVADHAPLGQPLAQPLAGPGASIPTDAVVAPAPAAPWPAPRVAAAAEHVVQPGDSLARIAKTRLGAESRWQEIAALNPGVDPQALKVGQKLALPQGAAPAKLAEKPAARAQAPTKVTAKAPTKNVVAQAPSRGEKSAAARSTVVKKGDTLLSIARRELGDERRWQEIRSLNPGLDPAKLAIGMRVKLPAKSPELIAAAGPTPAKKPRVQ
jgi:nucleoid-associated protein YgaU